MKGIHLIFILSIISQTLLFSQVVIKRNNQVSKEVANVNWSKEYTLFDYTTDEPIFPLIRNGQPVYKIYYASKEDPRPNYGEFNIVQVEGLKYYKFKNRETCFKFCLANKLNAVPTLTTSSISGITTTTATSGGNITADGGATITARGVVWSTMTNPTISLSTKTLNGNGTGSFTSSLTNLTPKTTYYVRAYAINSAGTGYGNEISFTTTDSSSVMGIPCPGTPTVKDIDGNTYNTVQIGTQCWTKENLRVTRYNDGTLIPLDSSGGIKGNGIGQAWTFRNIGYRTIYEHSNLHYLNYGYLYNWYAAKGVAANGSSSFKNLCPIGWHVPSDADWTYLVNILDNSGMVLEEGSQSRIAGGKMKTTGTTLWNSPNVGATNESGFSAIPGGVRYSNGSFDVIRNGAVFWCASEGGRNYAWGRSIVNSNTSIERITGINDEYNKSSGASVRCLRDTSAIVIIPTLTTTAITAITTNSATLGGVITSDGGAAITARGVIWSLTANPTIALTTKTSDGTGTGSFTSFFTNLTPKTTYYVRAYATNSAGTGYGNEITFTTAEAVLNIPCPGTPTMKDIDGNVYNTVQIGTQCWTKENLRVTKYRDGSIIPLDESGGTAGNGTGQTWSSRTTGARTVYAHSATNLATYGYLYNWYAVGDTKGLCPSGWHVPSDGEWNSLSSYLGNDPGVKLADTSWILAFGKPTNESGFSVKPGGYRDTTGRFSAPLISGNFWSITKFTSNLFWGRELYSKGYWETYSYYGASGLSVRCLKDTFSIVSIPSLTTTSITAVSTSSATSGGNITADGGASITARGVVWSKSTNPTISLTTKTSDGIGTGSFSSFLTSLTPKTTYYVRAYATNSAGTGYGNEITFTTSDSSIVMGIPCPGTPTVKDIDGNTYNTVQIGTQCWTKENLRVTKYRDGNQIPLVTVQSVWSNLTTDARSWYNNDSTNYENPHGKLYNWYATSDLRGICPSGWHVPSEQEWTFLCQFLDSSTYYTWGSQSFIAGGKLKTTGTEYWNSPNQGATNFSGFAALPSGARSSNSIGNGFYHFKDGAYFWSNSQYQSNDAFHIYLSKTNTWFYTNISFKTSGFSIRCIKDTSSVTFSIPTLTTVSASALTTSTSTSGGNITSDGGSSITTRGVVWSTTPKPTISLSTKTIDGIGIGTFTSALTGLTPKTTYYVRAYATNSSGTGYGNEITFTTTDSSSVMGIPCPGTPTVKDIDGNTYNTVQIGAQCWTKENLRVTKYRDGTVIPLDESGGTNGNGSGQTWGNRTAGARTVYAHSASNLATYGYLFNWYAVADSKGLCPNGWHVPSDGEWTILIKFLDNNANNGIASTFQSFTAGGTLKELGTTYWEDPNKGATNESGFSALPSGNRYSDGEFGRIGNIKSYCFFWSATVSTNLFYALGRDLYSTNSYIGMNANVKSVGSPVRCLKDTFSIVSTPTLTTTSISAITTTTATSGGNITSDGGASISARGVVWSTSSNPTIALTTKTSNGTGAGSFSSNLTNLTPKTTYYVRAYATNSAGTGYGNEISFATSDSTIVMGIPCPGTPTVKDIDGNTYNTVQIGTQCWTKENLRVTKYRVGTVIPLDESGGTNGNGTGQTWGNRNTGARTVYEHSASNLATYGYLYNWYAVADSKGLCPSGWHVPSDGEWTILITYLGGESIAGGKMKSTGTTYWNSPNTGATNEIGFSALPDGYRNNDGRYNNISYNAFFWSGTELNSSLAWYRYLSSASSNVYRGNYLSVNYNYKSVGASVRCLKD